MEVGEEPGLPYPLHPSWTRCLLVMVPSAWEMPLLDSVVLWLWVPRGFGGARRDAPALVLLAGGSFPAT